MSRSRCLTTMLLIFCLSLGILAAETGSPELPVGISIQIPEGKGPFPGVIICPGRGYHRGLPLIKDFADKAVGEGFVAVSFDWTFFTKGTNPSPDGAQEFLDLSQVINKLKQDPRVDKTRIYLAGKSLGSLFAYAMFREDKELKGCLLLTPIIPDSTSGRDYYPGLVDEYRKMVFILGDEDFDNCPLNHLYSYLAQAKSPVPVVVLGGGHSFNQIGVNPEKADPKILEYNTKMAVDAAVYWLKTFENPIYFE